MVKTNIRHPNDHRPLPPGIRPIPPPPPPQRPRTRASLRPAPEPTPPRSITPMPPRPRRPTRAARLAVLHALFADEDRLVVDQLAHVRDNMADYDARYPAAVQVRTHLGAAKWEQLERERARIATLAFEFRKLDREENSFPRSVLDRQIPKMKAYVRQACGESMEEVFDYLHEKLEENIEEDLVEGFGIQDGRVMSEIRELFHHRPFMWCIYNSYFPIRGRWGDPGRMDWEQLKDWVVWTLQHPMEEPSWFRWMRAEELVPLKAVSVDDTIWNAAMIEAFEDVGARFA